MTLEGYSYDTSDSLPSSTPQSIRQLNIQLNLRRNSSKEAESRNGWIFLKSMLRGFEKPLKFDVLADFSKCKWGKN